MGKQQDGFNGSFSGRLGNVVGYSWRGQWCVRSLPATFHDARTERQLEQRGLFADMVRFAGRAKRVLSISMRVVARNEHITESNYFVRLNKGCFSRADGVLTVDYGALRFSDGPVAPVAFDEPQLLDDTTISISFEKNPEHRNCSQDDEVRLVAYCPELDAFDFSDGIMRRSKRLTMSLNDGWVGKEVHLWGFVVDRAGRASQSTYIGSGVLDCAVAQQDCGDDNVPVDLDDAPAEGGDYGVSALTEGAVRGSASGVSSATPPPR